jgi:hypothetical protein
MEMKLSDFLPSTNRREKREREKGKKKEEKRVKGEKIERKVKER